MWLCQGAGEPELDMLVQQVADDVSLTFGTLFLRRRIEAMLPRHAELVDLAVTIRNQQRGLHRSNVGGWHSQGNIFAEKHPAIVELAGHIHSATRYISMIARQ